MILCGIPFAYNVFHSVLCICFSALRLVTIAVFAGASAIGHFAS
jgi:hypothetical protein